MPTAANLALLSTIRLIHLLCFVHYVMSQVYVDGDKVLVCPASASSNTASDAYISNLNSLFKQKLQSEAGGSLYYNASEGESPDAVYGLYLCKFDSSFRSCQSCIVAALTAVMQKCGRTKEALIWYQVLGCMLRFSDKSLSIVDTSSPLCMHRNTGKASVPGNASRNLIQSLEDIIAGPSLSAFSNATKATDISSTITLRSFGQCIPVLSSQDCRDCLNKTINLIPYCYDPPGTGFGTILFPSCVMGFELYPYAKSPARNKWRRAVWITVGTVVSAITVVLFGLLLLSRRRRYRGDKEEETYNQQFQLLQWGGEQVESEEFPLFSLGLALEATNNFSDENKLGEGGFGPVYKGTLADGQTIAVKRLSRTSGQGLQEFKNEVTLIAKLQHRNLVRLLGCCLEGRELLLIYEHMPNKSLDFFLFDATRGVQLDWKRRIAIINGIARGTLYLHEDSRLKVIHRDLKASNVLLDREMNPMISDFGMARIFSGTQNEANTNTVVGTYGYMSPEYAMEGLFSVKSDVFSFGVLLLEIISGKKNNGFHLSQHGESLLTFTWKLRCEGNEMDLMDPAVKDSCVPDELLRCIHIGLLCVQEDAADRPTMSAVTVMLASDSMTLPQPTQPAFSVGRVAIESGQLLSSAEARSVNDVTLSSVSPR